MGHFAGYSVAVRDGLVEIEPRGTLTLAQAFRQAVLIAGWRTNPVLATKAPGMKSLRELGW